MTEQNPPDTTPHQRSGESGFIMIMAILVLFVLSLLVAVAVAVSVQSSTSTTRDSYTKAAFAAAEAGLQVATYRINEFKPGNSECVTGTSKASPSSGVYCTEAEEGIGNGAKFKYKTSKELSSTNECAGKKIAVKSGFVQRCVISEGKVSGLSSTTRLQARVESAVGESLFGVKGIVGLEEVLVNGSVKATAITVSNKKIKGEGSAAFEKGFELCPGGKFEPAAGAERNHSGVTVGGVGGMLSNPSLEKTRSASECPIEESIPAEHATAASNQDSRITNHEDKASEQAWNLPKFSGSPKYTLELTSENMLELGVAEKITRYYFCKVYISNSAKLKIVPKAKVEIFIDSHEDNSECPEAGGKKVTPQFEISGAAYIENPNSSANLLIEMAGKGQFKITASGSLVASIYAPQAEVVLDGAGTLTGAVTANKVHLEAGSFIYSPESENITVNSSSGGAYTRQEWAQCSASSSSEGC